MDDCWDNSASESASASDSAHDNASASDSASASAHDSASESDNESNNESTSASHSDSASASSNNSSSNNNSSNSSNYDDDDDDSSSNRNMMSNDDDGSNSEDSSMSNYDDNSSSSDSSSSDSSSDEGTCSALYDELVHEAHAIQNRGGRRSGTIIMETRRFRSCFGAGKEVVMHLWDLLVEHNLLPCKATIKHLLWALYFMKVYATENSTCSVLGGSNGAIDPKTMRKWVWKFIEKIAELGPVVVSAVATH